jgi:hypothetical protein
MYVKNFKLCPFSKDLLARSISYRILAERRNRLTIAVGLCARNAFIMCIEKSLLTR